MKARLAALIAVLFVVSATEFTFAWNSIGHSAIAKLAFDELSEAKQLRLFVMLKRHPHYEEFLAAGRPPEVSEMEWAIVRSSFWSDWVRPRDKDFRGGKVTKYHRGEDHYINLPFIDPKDTEAFADKQVRNVDLANVISALKQRGNDLRTKTADIGDQGVSVCWLFHLVGDLHQPMHSVTYYSTAPAYLQGDQGGNKFGIRVEGRRWKLHTYWDDLLGEDPDYTDDSANRQVMIYQKAVAAVGNLRKLELPKAELEKLEKNTTYESWLQESYELAKTVAYRRPDGTLLTPGAPVPFKGPFPKDAPDVGPDYAKVARATADLRILLAGKRLAQRINLLLAK